MDDDSGDEEGHESEEDWLRQGWRSETEEVSSRDEAMHVGMNGLRFSTNEELA